ncbi:MAG: cytochrome c maturation protein CcmE [Gammaproteobacteria bacterium]|nr:cytochrome c maturation protein CcmE [Gammaproteobacteria bacterium]
MSPKQTRMVFVAVIVLGVAAATALALMAVEENKTFFYSSSQILAGEAPMNRTIRVGGLVEKGSVRRQEDGLTVEFGLTDTAKIITVQFKGILPDLFREGQSIIAIGKLINGNTVQAEEVLAKHDEKYMPPDVADALEKAAAEGKPINMANPHEVKKP